MHLGDSMLHLRGIWTFRFYEGDKEFGIDPETGLAIVLNPIVMERTYENLITTVGKQLVLDRLFGLSGVIALSNTGVGTSNTAAAVGNTTLTGATWKGYATAARTAEAVVATTSFLTSEANITIAEAALSNGSPATSAGTILNRLAPIGPFTKSTAVSMDIVTTVTQA